MSHYVGYELVHHFYQSCSILAGLTGQFLGGFQPGLPCLAPPRFLHGWASPIPCLAIMVGASGPSIFFVGSDTQSSAAHEGDGWVGRTAPAVLGKSLALPQVPLLRMGQALTSLVDSSGIC